MVYRRQNTRSTRSNRALVGKHEEKQPTVALAFAWISDRKCLTLRSRSTSFSSSEKRVRCVKNLQRRAEEIEPRASKEEIDRLADQYHG